MGPACPFPMTEEAAGRRLRRQVTVLIDEQIARRAASGDQKALEQLCAQTWRQLYRFVYHRVQNREEAEDITQEAYSRMLKARPASYSAGQFVTYLQTVALNVIRDRWRSAKARDRNHPLMQPIRSTGDAAEGIVQRDTVRRALDRLNPDYRTVLELRILRGLSTAETARQMGRTEAAVRTLQYRAIQALKEEIR